MTTPNKSLTPRLKMHVTPSSAGKPMSSGLKDRLKKCGRYHASPLSTNKPRTNFGVTSSTNKSHETNLAILYMESHHQRLDKIPRVQLHYKDEPKIDNIKNGLDYDNDTGLNKLNDETIDDHETIDDETIDDETIDNERIDETIDNETIDEETIDEKIDDETINDERIDDEKIDDETINDERIDETIDDEKIDDRIDDGTIDDAHGDSEIAVKDLKCSSELTGSCTTAVDKVEEVENITSEVTSDCISSQSIATSESLGNTNIGDSSNMDHSKKRAKLLEEIALKTDALRKLNLVKVYREKNDLEDMKTMTDKWRAVCQSALEDLKARLDKPDTTMKDLIDNLRVDPHLVRYDPDEETFY